MSEPRRDFTMARWVFARMLGFIFLCAFASLAVQIRGLAGARGIVPAQAWLDAVWNELGARALWQLPTLCWWACACSASSSR
jgi:lipase maturation factor 1